MSTKTTAAPAAPAKRDGPFSEESLLSLRVGREYIRIRKVIWREGSEPQFDIRKWYVPADFAGAEKEIEESLLPSQKGLGIPIAHWAAVKGAINDSINGKVAAKKGSTKGLKKATKIR